jgi:hypothetical protein
MGIRITITRKVSKKGQLICAKGEWSKSMMKAKGINQGNDTVDGFMRVYLFVYVIC